MYGKQDDWAGLAIHLFYRRMTRGWMRPWSGWNDVEAGRLRSEA
jgi:hypothetical protein